MMKRTIAIFIIVLAAVPAPITPGQGRIDTGTNIGANQVRLALPEMQAKSNDPQLVKFTALFNQVLKDDLDYSGSIAIVSKSFYPVGKFQSPTDIRVEDWTKPEVNAQGVAVFAALSRAADSARASGDPRGRGQIMADTLVERVTGQSSAYRVPLRVNVVISDDVLFGADGHALIEGYGPVPGDLARDLAARSRQKWLRRLYARPATGELVAMESRSRTFPKGLGELIDLRDQTCRPPWCDAPIRHHDHARAVEEGGETSAANGQGLCEACNHAKQAPGWTARPRPGPTHTVETRTPTGHSYRSQAPPARQPDIYWPLEIAC